MSRFIVAGITQLETIVKVKELPIQYTPYTGERDTIYISAGGDAFNESLALKWLGDEVEFMSVVGENENLAPITAWNATGTPWRGPHPAARPKPDRTFITAESDFSAPGNHPQFHHGRIQFHRA